VHISGHGGHGWAGARHDYGQRFPVVRPPVPADQRPTSAQIGFNYQTGSRRISSLMVNDRAEPPTSRFCLALLAQA
jgi:hypothetical protein